MIEQERIHIAALEAICGTVASFQNSPYSFLFESDLQADLFMKLRKRIHGSLSVPRLSESGGTYDLSLVYSEYGKRIDIVCLDASQIPHKHNLTRFKGFDTYIYDLPVLLGIELKYLKMGDRFDFQACVKDHDKLKELKVKFPFVLGFIQDEKKLLPFLEVAKTDWCWEKISEVNGLNQVFVIGPKTIYAAQKKT